MTTERATQCLVIPIKDPFPAFFGNHAFFFDATIDANPFISIFRFKEMHWLTPHIINDNKWFPFIPLMVAEPASSTPSSDCYKAHSMYRKNNNPARLFLKFHKEMAAR
jgi:hypothetical protein